MLILSFLVVRDKGKVREISNSVKLHQKRTKTISNFEFRKRFFGNLKKFKQSQKDSL